MAGCAGEEELLLMSVLCLSVTASRVPRGPGHSPSKQAPWGRLKQRRPSTFLGQEEREVGSRHRPERGAQSCLHHSAEQPSSRGPCLPPSGSILWKEGKPTPVHMGGPVREGEGSCETRLPSSLCLLPVPGSLYSTALMTDGLTRTKGGKAGEQASLWPLNPVTPQLCFPDKVLPASGIFFPPLPGPHKTRASSPNTQKKRKAVAADTLLMTLWLRRVQSSSARGRQCGNTTACC